MTSPVIDFETMRENCISIHQQMVLIFAVANHIGEDLNLKIKDAEQLKTHPDTKTWVGMGKFAKEVYDNPIIWDQLPDELWVKIFRESREHFVKKDVKAELLDCYYQLGGKNLYKEK